MRETLESLIHNHSENKSFPQAIQGQITACAKQATKTLNGTQLQAEHTPNMTKNDPDTPGQPHWPLYNEWGEIAVQLTKAIVLTKGSRNHDFHTTQTGRLMGYTLIERTESLTKQMTTYQEESPEIKRHTGPNQHVKDNLFLASALAGSCQIDKQETQMKLLGQALAYVATRIPVLLTEHLSQITSSQALAHPQMAYTKAAEITANVRTVYDFAFPYTDLQDTQKGKNTHSITRAALSRRPGAATIALINAGITIISLAHVAGTSNAKTTDTRDASIITNAQAMKGSTLRGAANYRKQVMHTNEYKPQIRTIIRKLTEAAQNHGIHKQALIATLENAIQSESIDALHNTICPEPHCYVKMILEPYPEVWLNNHITTHCNPPITEFHKRRSGKAPELNDDDGTHNQGWENPLPKHQYQPRGYQPRQSNTNHTNNHTPYKQDHSKGHMPTKRDHPYPTSGRNKGPPQHRR